MHALRDLKNRMCEKTRLFFFLSLPRVYLNIISYIIVLNLVHWPKRTTCSTIGKFITWEGEAEDSARVVVSYARVLCYNSCKIIIIYVEGKERGQSLFLDTPYSLMAMWCKPVKTRLIYSSLAKRT